MKKLEEFFNTLFVSKIEKILENSIFSSTMLINLINDLLDLAKLEQNTFQFNYEYFNIIDTIKNAFTQVSYLANQK